MKPGSMYKGEPTYRTCICPILSLEALEEEEEEEGGRRRLEYDCFHSKMHDGALEQDFDFHSYFVKDSPMCSQTL